MSRIAEREAALLDLTRRVVDRAHGGEALEAYATHSVGTSVRVFDTQVERLTNSESRGVGIRLVVDGRLGFASTSDVSDAGLDRVVAEARSNAEHGTPDPAKVLPDPPPSPPAEVAGLVVPALADVPVERKVALALEIERLATTADRRVQRVQAAGYGDGVTCVAIASTTGLAESYARTDASAYVMAMARDDGETQTGVGVTNGRSFEELDVDTAARDSVTRATRLLGASKPATATVPVVFDPMVTSEFLGVVAGTFSADAVQKGRSLFAGKVGESIASDFLSVVDDGRIPEGPDAAPFDDEGVPTQRTVLVSGGVLRAFLRNTETAAREADGARSTGNAARGYRSTPGVSPSNVYFDGPTVPAADVLRRAGTGLYVQQVSGMHSGVHPVSGEFSVGATGLWIRGGELAEPVRELTVSSTIVDMLRAVSCLGDDRRFVSLGGGAAGCTLLLDAMTVAGS